MTPKPEARIIPSQDEFDAWCESPVTRFVAAAYGVASEKQRQGWERMFDQPLVPADLAMQRAILKTREDAYRAFLETTLDDYISLVSGDESVATLRAAQGRAAPPKPQASSGRRSSWKAF